MKIIIYDDENLSYKTGEIISQIFNEPEIIEYQYLDEEESNKIEIYGETITIAVDNYKELETIKLDPTLMKRIAKYNKEIEIKKYDKIIEEKQKQIEELDNILQDKDKRVEKIKEFIANIYDLDIYDEDDEYEEDW